ncbi:hypothetical protein LCGC14_2047050 [marine sediment metagenome]|uniref:Replication-associated protein ORF2/G2P domain-containing protein n=1 Tax=marine sediment metagenome TaxID=412755 RepID=A0A0F9H3J5_9ZZZZ
MLCQSHTIVKNEKDRITFYPLRCRCWHCPECHAARTARLIDEAKQGKPNIFITLTSRRRPNWTPDYAARRLAVAFRIIRAEYLRAHGKSSFPFLCVFEKTKRGWPHLHIVGRCKWLDQKWLSNRMRQLTDSPIVDVRRISNLGKITNYITKYIGKDPSKFEGTKRYWRSQDYLRPSPDEEPPIIIPYFYWETLNENWRACAEQFQHLPGTLTWHRTHAVYERQVPP